MMMNKKTAGKLTSFYEFRFIKKNLLYHMIGIRMNC